MTIEMQPVESSNILAVGYDGASSKLHVQFKNGTYVYDNVGAEIHAEMMKSDSVGKFFQSNIRSKFDFKKMEEQKDE